MANIAKAQNEIVPKKQTLTNYLSSEGVQKTLMNALGNKLKADKLIADLSAVGANNPDIQNCDFATVVSAGLMAGALNLPLSPQLGYCYVVPFEDRRNGRKVGTFVLGYKGYIQLAERTGQYRKIIVLEIKEGEFKSYNPMTEELKADVNDDSEERDNLPTAGYYAMFELLNGFTKTMYWSRKKMESHAKKYSKGYASDLKNKTDFSFWAKSFDDMAKKTLIRQLIGKWGIMSTEMEKAFDLDNSEEAQYGDVSFSAEPAASADEIFGAVGEVK